ncbi:MAG TPA: hypothetical protein VJT72_16960 [Pseudonocardiaceae bacterium]|nr:hypothetical protein [Pseudonocardiaceae bacterium]
MSVAPSSRRWGSVGITTALRTAWDLSRWLPMVEAVVALDALARVGRFAPALCSGSTAATRGLAGAVVCPE